VAPLKKALLNREDAEIAKKYKGEAFALFTPS
jgi:hypothetical protein